MTSDGSFILDADTFICLHSLSVLSLLADRPMPMLHMTEYVARHELCGLTGQVTALEASGHLSVAALSARDENFRRFRRDGTDKGEAEIVAWCLLSPRLQRPRYISNDRRARALASTEGVHPGDLLDLVIALLQHGTLSEAEVQEKLAPWDDRTQQRCRPAGFTTLAETLQRRMSTPSPRPDVPL